MLMINPQPLFTEVKLQCQEGAVTTVPDWSHPYKGIALVGLRTVQDALDGKTLKIKRCWQDIGPYRVKPLECDWSTVSVVCLIDNGRLSNLYWMSRYWMEMAAVRLNNRALAIAHRAGLLHPDPRCIPSWRDFGFGRSR